MEGGGSAAARRVSRGRALGVREVDKVDGAEVDNPDFRIRRQAGETSIYGVELWSFALFGVAQPTNTCPPPRRLSRSRANTLDLYFLTASSKLKAAWQMFLF
eukprot:211824-Pleurochrysis_carterae.AAC.1